jgi:hypothetical protein
MGWDIGLGWGLWRGENAHFSLFSLEMERRTRAS